MYKKMATLVLTSSLLFSCQQAVTKSTEKVASELPVSKSEVSKIAPKKPLSEDGMKPLSFTATVKYMNLEGGFFGLIAKDGTHWLPINLNQTFKQEGAIIKVRGNAVKNMMTIQQWGKPFSITYIELIKAGLNGKGKELH
jgi:hypothetical protein